MVFDLQNFFLAKYLVGRCLKILLPTVQDLAGVNLITFHIMYCSAIRVYGMEEQIKIFVVMVPVFPLNHYAR